MKRFLSKLTRITFSSFLGFLPITQTSLLASDLFLANYIDEEIEEVRVKRVNKKGNLVVKFCSKLKDLEGYVEVNNQKFMVKDADKIKPRKIVWQNTNLPKLKGDVIEVNNLLARYYEENSQDPLKFLDEGECAAGILPLIFIGAGIVAGAGGSGGSGSSSSN